MQASRDNLDHTKKIFGVLYKREQQASRQRVELLSVTAASEDGSVTSGACAEKSGGRARSERELKSFPVFLAEMRKARQKRRPEESQRVSSLQLSLHTWGAIISLLRCGYGADRSASAAEFRNAGMEHHTRG